MTLRPDTRLGAYHVIAVIGSGGMGEVYRARDAKLNRDVALKVIPDLFASDPDRLARFRREAQVLASLNHPNIGAIYGFEEAEGIRALVLELVEGPTLADRIAQGVLAVDEALPIATQIASALEAAHEQGIVHRDLKPANIKLRPDGTVKVLDFGLAKPLAPDSASATSGDLSHSPTLTSPAATGMGVILGTAAYMSPEQARGRPVDKRSDIWAFGCVVYEMLTGRRAFPGSDFTEILAGIIKSEPNWDALPDDVPPVLRVCLKRCLHKDARQRVRDMGDLRLALEGAFETHALTPNTSGVGLPPRSRFWRRPELLVTAGAILVAVTGVTVWSLMQPAPSVAPPTTRFTIPLPPSPATVRGGRLPIMIQPVAISPDGRRILYTSRQGGGLYSRTLDQLDWTPIRGTEDVTATLIMSPDGAWVGFIDFKEDALKKVPLNGAPSAIICRLSGAGVFRGASWGANGSIVFATTAAPGLMQVPAAGGVPAPLTSPQGEIHLHPHFLPGGKALLYTVRRPGEPDRVAVFSLDANESRMIVDGSSPRFASGGHLVFARGTDLWVVPFDSDRLQVVGDAVLMVKDVALVGGSVLVSMSSEGALVYSPATAAVQSERLLVWVDRNGREEPTTAPARRYAWPRLSPDGTRVAVAVTDEDQDIWIWDVRRSGLTPFAHDRAVERTPVWMPDSQRLVFSSDRDGSTNLFSQAVDGTGPLTRLTNTPNEKQAFSVSPDGTRLIFGEQVQRFDLWSLTLNGPPSPQTLLQTPFGDRDGEISPDGRWLSYSSDESGQFEIYVRPFPNVGEQRFPISTSGGAGSVWARNGRELFYQAPTGAIMAVPVETSAGFAAGAPRAVVDATSYVASPLGRMYDVSPDGQRFLMLKASGQAEPAVVPPSLTVVLNWHEELKARAPAR